MSGPRPDGDPLDEPSHELRELYRHLQPPPLADGADEADPETARVVHWLQGAWRELEVPPARVPLAVRRAPRLARVAALAAAALLVLGALLWRTRGRALVDPEHLPPVVQAPAPSGAIEVLAALPDRLELRSGPVRLVLLEPPPEQPVRETNESSSGG